jgi:hypothetical protein
MSYLINSLKSIEHFTIPDRFSTHYDKGLNQLSALFSGDTSSFPKKYVDNYKDALTKLGVIELLKEVSKSKLDNFIRNFEKYPKDLSDNDITIKIEILTILIKGSVTILKLFKENFVGRMPGQVNGDVDQFLDETMIGIKMLLDMILLGTQYELFKRKTLVKAKKSVNDKLIENFSQEEEVEVLLSLKACEESLKSSVSGSCPDSSSSSTSYIVGLAVMCGIIIMLLIMLAM